MPTPVNLAVTSCSSTGTVATIAKAMAQYAETAGAEARLRKAGALAPQAAIDPARATSRSASGP